MDTPAVQMEVSPSPSVESVSRCFCGPDEGSAFTFREVRSTDTHSPDGGSAFTFCGVHVTDTRSPDGGSTFTFCGVRFTVASAVQMKVPPSPSEKSVPRARSPDGGFTFTFCGVRSTGDPAVQMKVPPSPSARNNPKWSSDVSLRIVSGDTSGLLGSR